MPGRHPQRPDGAAVAWPGWHQHQSQLHRSFVDVPLRRKLQLGHWGNQEFTDLVRKVQVTFNDDEQTRLLQQAHALMADEPSWLFIVHDLNPPVTKKKVTGFHPAQGWSQDFTQISMI